MTIYFLDYFFLSSANVHPECVHHTFSLPIGSIFKKSITIVCSFLLTPLSLMVIVSPHDVGSLMRSDGIKYNIYTYFKRERKTESKMQWWQLWLSMPRKVCETETGVKPERVAGLVCQKQWNKKIKFKHNHIALLHHYTARLFRTLEWLFH